MADRSDGGPDDRMAGQPDDQGGSALPPYPPSEGRQAGPPQAYPPPPPSGYPPPSGGYPPPGAGYGQGGYPQGGYPRGGFPGGGAPYGYGYGSTPRVPQEVYAGYWPRVGGWLIDAAIVWFVSYLVSIPLRSVDVAQFTISTRTGSVTRTGRFSALEVVAEVVIVLVYGALFCGSTRGQTPGMMVVGVRAVDRDTGGRIGFVRALWRGLVEYILFIVLFVPWILDMLFPLWDGRRQTLHDKASRTVVVKAAQYPPARPR